MDAEGTVLRKDFCVDECLGQGEPIASERLSNPGCARGFERLLGRKILEIPSVVILFIQSEELRHSDGSFLAIAGEQSLRARTGAQVSIGSRQGRGRGDDEKMARM